MTLTVLKGQPGSGKSRRLIQRVNESREAGRPVHTFVSSDFPWPSNHGALWIHRRLVCREPGTTAALDHFVSSREMAALLEGMEPGDMVAVDDAYAYSPEDADTWIDASQRGLDVIIAAPSYQQLQLMKDDAEVEEYSLKCQACGLREATMPTIDDEDGSTRSLCETCFAQAATDARATITTLLRAQDPYPGEDGLYQPVEISETSGWRVARPDTLSRAARAYSIAEDLGLTQRRDGRSPTYLDVGCNTGSFSDYFASRGFRAKGVDATSAFIRVARMMDSFFRRQQRPGQQFVSYERLGAFEYLRDTQSELFDVTTSFATLQWVMLQRSFEDGLRCFQWLASKTTGVCIIEFGYTSEDLYRGKLDVEIDRAWVVDAMHEYGSFADVRVVERGPDGLQREMFVGVK